MYYSLCVSSLGVSIALVGAEQKFYEDFDNNELARWSFLFEGCLTNKGAAKILQEKMDEEFMLWLQHRPKQGLFLCILPFNSPSQEQIGGETILRSHMRMTTPCWMRCLYRCPPLIKQAWLYWKGSDQSYTTDNAGIIMTFLPRDRKNNPDICDNMIKACPFCSQNNRINRRK